MRELVARLGWAACARIVSAVGSALLLLIMARVWVPGELAEYSIVFGYLAILQTLPLLGLGFAVTRDVAADAERAPGHLHAALLIALVASLGFALMLGLSGETLYGGRLRTAFWAAGLTLLTTGFIAVFEAQMMGYGRLGLVALMNAVENLARLLGFVVVAALGGGIVDFLLLIAIVRAVVVLGYLAVPSVRAVFQASALPRQVASYLRQAPSFLGAVLIGALISRLDVLCLSAMVSPTDLGIYAIAARIYEMALMVPVTFTIALFPMIARLETGEPREFRAFTRRILAVTASGAVVAAALAAIAIGPIVQALFPPAYLAAVSSIRMLLVAAAMASVSQILASVIIVRREQNADLVVQLAALAALPVTLGFAVPWLGLQGAALGVLASALTQLLGRYLVCRPHIFAAPPLAHGTSVAGGRG